MKQLFRLKVLQDHYRAEACLVWCFDQRFSRSLRKLLQIRRWSKYDLVMVAGGAKSLISRSDESERRFVLDQVTKSLKLHHAKRIVLMLHQDCGAYGGSSAFPAGEELHRLENDLLKAKALIGRSFPKIVVEGLLVDFEKASVV